MWRLLFAVVLAAVGVGAIAAPAAAEEDDGGWVIDGFDATLRLAADGSVEVTEDIAVDFGDLERHGIYRHLPLRYALPADGGGVSLPDDADPADYWRVLEIDVVEVTSTAPAEYETEREGGEFVLRVGDPDETVTGSQRYEIRYVVRGALVDAGDEAVLRWNVTGGGWAVPITEATATVTGLPLSAATCAQGEPGSTTECGASDAGGDTARFLAEGLSPGEQLSIRVDVPADAVTVPPPLLEDRWRLSRALTGHSASVPLTAVTALAGFGTVALLARRGRDQTTSAAVDSGASSKVGGAAAPQLEPPEGLRPAQLHVVVDERVDADDLSATIVDLAARGFLRIEQVAEGKENGRGDDDWKVRRTGTGDPASLASYERHLLDALFADGPEVTLSEVRGEFSDEYGRFRELVYEDAVARGWFPRNPATVRAVWLGIALAAVFLTGTLLATALILTEIAAAAVPLFLAALVLLILHGRMPHRTAAGADLAARGDAFRRFLRSRQTERAFDGRDASALFSRHLPYAMSFGAVPQLVQRFTASDLPVERWAPTWYAYPYGYALWHDPQRLTDDLGSLSSGIGGGLSTAPASSGSSGVSAGGGFGGGGGGSW